MFKNYLKIAFRSLWRNKVHSSINIIGLSLGIACCVLIVLFVKDEWTFDRFHSKADRIYRVWGKEDWGINQVFFYTNTPFPMGPTLKDNFPEVESQVRITWINSQVKSGDNIFSAGVAVAGEDFFDVFDFKILAGDKQALHSQNSVVLNENIAKNYFGDADPINKVVQIQLGDKFEDFVVKAVTEAIPTNSSIRYGVLISDLNYPKLYNERVLTSGWFNINPVTYVLLREGVQHKVLEQKFPALFKTVLGEEDFTKSKYKAGLQPLTSIHLDTNFPASGSVPVGNPKYTMILAAIAALILFVACINFVTLSIGRSLKRAKEVGIRKVVGAERKQLVMQFLGEAVIVSLISLAVGLLLAVLNLPLFNELSGKELVFPVDGFMAIVVLSLVAVIGIISGSYPAFVLSGFKPISILKGASLPGSSRLGLRKALVSVQLILSIFLISSTLLMRKQLWLLQNKNLGFNKEQLAVLQLNVPRTPQSSRLPERVKVGFEKAEQFKTELSQYPDILAVCASSHDFGDGSWTNIGYTDDDGVYRSFNMNIVDDEYIPLMKMELVAGRNFAASNPSDSKRGVIVNEAFVKEYGWKNALGKRIPGKNFSDHEVVGVVKDFNYTTLYTKVEPLIMVMDPSIVLPGTENINFENNPIPKVFVRIRAGSIASAVDQLKTSWDKLTGGEEFVLTFVDQALAAQYRSDQNLGKIVTIATLLAIVIGSLGLYGLASLTMQTRTKEISIRKVMGATEQSLLVLLSKDYIYLVVISLILSVPITWYLMNHWLQSFEYRVDIGWESFFIAGGISLLIAIFTIGYQTIKTASAQPAETLKYE